MEELLIRGYNLDIADLPFKSKSLALKKAINNPYQVDQRLLRFLNGHHDFEDHENLDQTREQLNFAGKNLLKFLSRKTKGLDIDLENVVLHFGSISEFLEATADDLIEVEGIRPSELEALLTVIESS